MLSETDLDELIGFYETGPADEARSRWRTLFDPNVAGPITLVNRFKLRERARYADGRPATGVDALMAYAATSVPALAKVGGRFLVSSPVVAPLFGTPGDTDLVVVGWYPHRRALGETIVLNFESGHYYSFNPTASEIWIRVCAGHPVAVTTEWVARRFSGDAATIRAEVAAFVRRLEEEQLIRPAAETAPAAVAEASGRSRGIVRLARLREVHRHEELFDPIDEVGDVGWPRKPE